MEIMQQSPNKMKAVGLLNHLIESQDLPPPPLSRNEAPSDASSPTASSALRLLTDIIGEMESVVCHKTTSVQSLGRPHEDTEAVRPARISLRRGASRELAATITGELKRPEGEESGKRGHLGSQLRREASSDLSATITGDLKRPDSEGESPSPVGRRGHRGSHLRREASSDLSATITGTLQRPPEDQEHQQEEGERSIPRCPSGTGTPPGGPSPRGQGIAFFGEEDLIPEGNEDGDGAEKYSATATATATAPATATATAPPRKQYADDAMTVNWLDLRVGKIVSVHKHESSEKLYCESIDVGEEVPRSIASGLAPFYSLAEMEGRMVVVVCNLKARNLGGFPSNGMVLCATAASSESSSSDGGDHRRVELLSPPAGAQPGDRVFAQNVPGTIVTPQKCDKKKIFPKVAAGLRVDDCGRFSWDGLVLSVGALAPGQACTAPSLRDAEVG
jgi:methionine--tRNA ligase beta chain